MENNNLKNGKLKIHISGNWEVKDFSKLLNDFEIVYSRLNGFLFISEEFDKKIERISYSRNREIRIHPREYYYIRQDKYDDQEIFESISRSALNCTTSLKIHGININSPGWAELIGNLNPLKVIADFISKWREENTKREDIKRKYELEDKKIKADLIKALIERGDNLIKEGSYDFMESFVSYAMNDSLDKLKEIGREIRVESVSVEEN